MSSPWGPGVPAWVDQGGGREESCLVAVCQALLLANCTGSLGLPLPVFGTGLLRARPQLSPRESSA